MSTGNVGNDVTELSRDRCWALLRAGQVGRLAVWVEGHPDIFPINYVLDHATVVFRSGEGTKLAGALSGSPVAFEVDGYDQETAHAWSVVIKGEAESIHKTEEVLDTVSLPLFPWHGGGKDHFARIVPSSVTGRQFKPVDPETWRTPWMDAPRASTE
ncbi:MAG TPA: pyridoxamine 5'-phosphate oxidase family protein [Arthrobacter sp.]|nr:pyridoxamine 5'-phosphate oxidase family protein [Arthrobacter sp.]